MCYTGGFSEMAVRRRLTKWNSLQVLKSAGFPVSTVIDIGVHDAIRQAYAGLNYRLEAVAASDRHGALQLHGVRSDADGVVSHVSPAYGETSEVRTVQRVILDTYVEGAVLEKPYLIKVDVNGHETEVLQGARQALFDTSCLIVETTLFHLLERLRLAESTGLVLSDIVDLSYYHGCLYQCDLVFVSDRANRVMRRVDPRMRMAFEPFDAAAWYGLHSSPNEV